MSPPAYKHRLFGRCDCGHQHGMSAIASRPWRDVAVAPPPSDIAPIDVRDAVYAFALDLLPLRRAALEDLQRRELSADAIARHRFRSLPMRGSEHAEFMTQMLARFGEKTLSRVPGFTDKNRRFNFRTAGSGRDGYIIPYRDEMGRVTGFQIRTLGHADKAKYLTPTHAVLREIYGIAGTPFVGCMVHVTEGGLKGIVAHELGGYITFAVAGQALMPEHIDAIRRLKPAGVMVALDREANVSTDRARERWLRDLLLAGIPAVEGVWEGSEVGGPKGLDDLLQAFGAPRERLRAFAPPALGERRDVVDSVEPGRVRAGLPLEAARAVVGREIRAFLGAMRKPHARLIHVTPGAGKTTAAAQALREARQSARIVVGTSALASELTEAHGYRQIHGRSPDNCERYDVVHALGEAGHDVEKNACGTPSASRCPFRSSCQYYAQFNMLGIWVGTTEQLFNQHFLAGKAPVIVDDGALDRALIQRRRIDLPSLERAFQQLQGRRHEPLVRLLRIVVHAITDLPTSTPVFGSAVWDLMARAAARYQATMPELIGDLDVSLGLPEPGVDDDGFVTAEGVASVPSGHLKALVRVLRRELPRFASFDDFNSYLRIDPRGIDIWEVRDHILDRDDKVRIAEHSLLVLDATPIRPLVDHLLAEHSRQEDLVLDVAIPESVTIVQYATSTGSYVILADADRRSHALAEVEAERRLHPAADPVHEGIVLFKKHRDEAIALGFDEAQVLTFGSARGTNALDRVERLHVLGRPMPPTDELLYLAQVIHHDEDVVRPGLVLRNRAYGGQRRAVAVLDFEDPRPSALLRAFRDDEILQVVYRARPSSVATTAELWDAEATRSSLRIVIHGSHPIDGLRVDELHTTTVRRDVNRERADGAEARIRAAAERLVANGERPTTEAIARAAGAAKETVRKVLGTNEDTLKRDLYKGVFERPRASPPATPMCSSCGAPDLAEGVRFCERCQAQWETHAAS